MQDTFFGLIIVIQDSGIVWNKIQFDFFSCTDIYDRLDGIKWLFRHTSYSKGIIMFLNKCVTLMSHTHVLYYLYSNQLTLVDLDSGTCWEIKFGLAPSIINFLIFVISDFRTHFRSLQVVLKYVWHPL